MAAETPAEKDRDARGDSNRYLPADNKRHGIGLCLSGGGYRAALFHLGALRRLNETGILSKVETISGVSGGSILAAFLADRLRPWPKNEPVADFDKHVADDFRDFTRRNIRTLWALRRLIRPWDPSVAVESLVKRYHTDITQLHLSDLPDWPDEGPRFVFSATDMAFGVNWTSERNKIGSYMAGHTKPPEAWSVARAIAASSCFPPVFVPMAINIDPQTLKGGDASHGDGRDALIRGLRLSDGGLYDNMALEPVWKDHRVVLVSDGGATFDHAPDAGLRDTLKRLGRYSALQGRQASAVRKRWLIANYELEQFDGTYWGIGSAASHYDKNLQGYDAALVDDYVSEVRTDLDHFTDSEAEILQNHGYTLTDAALRTHSAKWWEHDLGPSAPPSSDWLDNDDEVRAALAQSHKRKLFGRWRRR